jgi:hypothetical protein
LISEALQKCPGTLEVIRSSLALSSIWGEDLSVFIDQEMLEKKE